jgi:hypothetical protein
VQELNLDTALGVKQQFRVDALAGLRERPETLPQGRLAGYFSLAFPSAWPALGIPNGLSLAARLASMAPAADETSARSLLPIE